jgi:hypothetical protein
MGVITSWLDDPRPDGGEDHRGQYPVGNRRNDVSRNARDNARCRPDRRSIYSRPSGLGMTSTGRQQAHLIIELRPRTRTRSRLKNLAAAAEALVR